MVKTYISLFRTTALPTVPETLLKRRRRNDEVRKARAFARAATKKVSKETHKRGLCSCRLHMYKVYSSYQRLPLALLYAYVPFTYSVRLQLRKEQRKVIFKRAEKYVQEYRKKELDEIRLKREARKKGNFYVPDQAKVVFVVRIRG